MPGEASMLTPEDVVNRLARLSFARLRPSERRKLAEALDTPELRGQVFDRFGAFLRDLPLETADGQDELLVAVADLNMTGFWDLLPEEAICRWYIVGCTPKRLQYLASLVQGYESSAANRIQHVLNPQRQRDEITRSTTDIPLII
ncbi:hypothetical protein V6768_13165 [Tistrella mobilis]